MSRRGRRSGQGVPDRDHGEIEALVLVLAGRQHGLVTHAQLRAVGLSDSGVRKRVARGRLHRLYPGVYAVGRADVPIPGWRLAAVLACGDGALLSHLSCAKHRGFRDSSASRLDVSIPRRSAVRRSGIRVHRRTRFHAEDRDILDAVPCTSVARTLLDCCPLVDDRVVERMIEKAHILEVYDHRAVERLLAREPAAPGSRRLRRVLGIARPGKTLTRSGLEEAMLALCRRAGLPEPELNAYILLGGVHTEVDFLWRRERVAVEVDSWKYHRQRGQFERDRRRDQLLELEGWGHARFTDTEITVEAARIASVIRALLALAVAERRRASA